MALYPDWLLNPYTRQPQSYIRFLHASPDAPRIDIYIDGILFAQGLPYRGFTEYRITGVGEHNIAVFPAGQTANPVISTNINISAQSIYTVAAAGMLRDISLFTVPDPVLPHHPGTVNIRFVHLSPDTPAADIITPDGTVLFGNVAYKQITGYIPINPGVYTIQARATGTGQIILNVPNINLLPNRFYTFYAVGLIGGNPPLQVLIPLDGSSYIKF